MGSVTYAKAVFSGQENLQALEKLVLAQLVAANFKFAPLESAATESDRVWKTFSYRMQNPALQLRRDDFPERDDDQWRTIQSRTEIESVLLLEYERPRTGTRENAAPKPLGYVEFSIEDRYLDPNQSLMEALWFRGILALCMKVPTLIFVQGYSSLDRVISVNHEIATSASVDFLGRFGFVSSSILDHDLLQVLRRIPREAARIVDPLELDLLAKHGVNLIEERPDGVIFFFPDGHTIPNVLGLFAA